MCQLLGLSSNLEVDIAFSLREFRHRGKGNHHGWGFAFLYRNEWKVIKKPESLVKALPIKEEISGEFKFKSSIIIGHVRLASCGDIVHRNTHPFQIENWVFAHNGTVKKIIENVNFPLREYEPGGKTDSEYAFCYLLSKIKLKAKNIGKILETEAAKIKQYGEFNFLLSDGKSLYAYGNHNLYYVQRKAPFESVQLKDDQYKMNLADIKAPDEKAVLIATDPLTKNEKWEPINGLKIFSKGIEIQI